MNYVHICSKVLFLETDSEDPNEKCRTECFDILKNFRRANKYICHCDPKISDQELLD